MALVEKIDISERYPPESELRLDSKPYQAYYEMLANVFDFSKIQSVCDVGCSTGHLLSIIKQKHPDISVLGFEFFEYQIQNAPENIREYIKLVDLRDPLFHMQKYDLVNCTEVGEHIDEAYAGSLLNNLRNLTRRFLIMSWSDSGGINDPQNDPHHQHLNPLSKEKFMALMRESGFEHQEEASGQLLRQSNRPHFHDWWRKSLSVWKVVR